jgi:hypothetical protein
MEALPLHSLMRSGGRFPSAVSFLTVAIHCSAENQKLEDQLPKALYRPLP